VRANTAVNGHCEILWRDGVLADRREAGFEVEEAVLEMPIGEMITTSDGLMDLVEKVRVDVALGQADVPTLYESFYRTISPAGGFPGKAVDLNFNTIQANVVFFEKLEGGEVQFGTLAKGVPAVARLRTWAAGFEWTEDMVEWDSTWEFELVNQAFGRAYNQLLNHIHLSPIFAPPVAYTSNNQTAADATAGASLAEKTLRTFQAAYRKSIQPPAGQLQRTWSAILASEVDRFQIEEALLQPVLDANGNQLPRVPVNTIVYYDGATAEMGTETYTFPGVTAKKVYAVYPSQRMLELVHHALRVDADRPDLSRLVETQVVGRTRRGLYADVVNSVEELTLP
jgi:hypothetical protein